MRKGILASALLLLSGCLHDPGGIAPSTVPLAPGSYRVLKDVSASDCRFALLGLIPLTRGNRTANAVHEALLEAPGATALVNVTSDSYSQYWILWSHTCTVVEGTAVAVD